MAKRKILLYDTFTGDNSTALSSHSPNKQYVSSAAWAVLSTASDTIPQIQTNFASGTASSTQNSAIIDVDRIHGRIESNVTAGTNSSWHWVKYLFRVKDSSDYWAVQVESSTANTLSINHKVPGSAEAVLLSRSCTFTDATAYDIEIDFSGNRVGVNYHDGGAELNYSVGLGTASSKADTKWHAEGKSVGIWMYSSSTVTTHPLVDWIRVLG